MAGDVWREAGWGQETGKKRSRSCRSTESLEPAFLEHAHVTLSIRVCINKHTTESMCNNVRGAFVP